MIITIEKMRAPLIEIIMLITASLLVISELLPGGNTLYGQDILGKMHLKDISDDPEIRSKIPRSAEEAMLIVKSQIPEMEFESNNKILRIEKRDEGIWYIFVQPGTHRINFKARGFLSQQERIYFARKQVKGYLIEAQTVSEGRDPKAFLFITSQPPDAEIFVDSTYLGTTPYQGLIPPGTYAITVKKPPNYKDETRTVALKTDETNTHRFVLQAAFATLEINSTPEDAEVYINGQAVGKTPYQNSQMIPGQYTLLIQKELYRDVVKQITLKEVEVIRENFQLEPNFGTLVIQAEPGIDVFIDGKIVRRGESGYRLKPGYHTIEGQKAGKSIYKKEINLSVNETLDLAVEPEKRYGKLIVFLNPVEAEGAAVFLDGQQIGTAPGIFPQLLTGIHFLTIQREGYQPYRSEIEIEDSKDKTVQINLEKEEQPPAQSPPPVARQAKPGGSKTWLYIAGGAVAAGVGTFFLMNSSGGNGGGSDLPGIQPPIFPDNQ